jgi:glucose dehydrogenase
MFKKPWTHWPLIAATAFVAAGVAVVMTGLTQTPNGKWWPGYGNGADNSRYFASRQINKSNVNELHVAWNYPYGDTSFGPIVVRGVIYGRGRNGSLVAIDAKSGRELWIRENMNGMTSRGNELLGIPRWARSAVDFRDEQPAAGT